MNTPDDTQVRATFERECFAYYQRIKAAGWSHPEEGDATPESLFWRQENGMYGVHQIEAAWQGFQMAASLWADDADRFVRLGDRAHERWLRPETIGSEFPDHRTHWVLPPLICSGPVGGVIRFREAVDIATGRAGERLEQ